MHSRDPPRSGRNGPVRCPPLCAHVLPVRGVEGLVWRLFEPLGYDLVTEPIALDCKLGHLGESWLLEYPEKELIANRYLRFKRSRALEVLMRLAIEDVIEEEAAESSVVQVADRELTEGLRDAAEEFLERTSRMHDFRLDTVLENLQELGAKRVVDLGCGLGKLLTRLLAERMFKKIVGIDVSTASLENAKRRLRLESLLEQ